MPALKLIPIYILHINFVFGNCRPGKTELKENATDISGDIQKKRVEYEINHMKSYNSAPEEYNQWPELTEENQMEVCKKYIGTLFLDYPRSILTINTLNICLRYREIENSVTQISSILILKALRCQISPPLDHRKYIEFIKSPTKNCLYLSGRISQTSVNYIMEEICLGKKYDPWKICSYSKFKRQIEGLPPDRFINDDPHARKEYESNHFKEYNMKRMDYEKWPQMKEKDMEKCCQSLIKQLHPNNKYTELKVRHHSILLKYMKIQSKENNEIPYLKLGALQCQLPNKKKRKHFEFVRAPKPDCVHLIKKVCSRCIAYYITKEICEGLQLLETYKGLNLDLNIPIDQD